MEEIIRRVKIFEGYRSRPYLCPAGKWTVGYGYNFQDRGFKTDILVKILKNGFSEELAEELLIRDLKECIRTIEKIFPFYLKLNDPRRAVVTDMVYQLGLGGFRQFRRMIEALEKNDFEKAAYEMTDSLWYSQSGRRSRINTLQMRTGIWQEI